MHQHLLDYPGVEGALRGPPCQSHSKGNAQPKGNQDVSGGGKGFEEFGIKIAELNNGRGSTFEIVECAPEIHKPNKLSGRSPYDEQLANAPGFFDVAGGKLAKANRIMSPLTD